MQKWEYLTVNRQAGSWSDDRFDGRSPGEKLTHLGSDGWELVSVCYDGAGYHFYFKRALEKVKAAPRKSRAKSKVDDAPPENTESIENSIQGSG